MAAGTKHQYIKYKCVFSSVWQCEGGLSGGLRLRITDTRQHHGQGDGGFPLEMLKPGAGGALLLLLLLQ